MPGLLWTTTGLVDARTQRAAVRMTPNSGAPVDSLRSTHARVAALARHRQPNDPELASARHELAQCRDETRALRARISSLPPAVCSQLLAASEGAAASV